jgi:hypothetical protein
MKDRDEEIHREKGEELPLPSMVFSNLEAPRSWLFGVLWVLHCACMSDYILSHWRSTSPQALSSLTKDWGMELKCLNTLILPNFFW